MPGLSYRLVLARAGAAVALTVGFADVIFVRLVGLICLGGKDPPKPPWGWARPAAVVVLALGCLGITAVTPLEIRVIAPGCRPRYLAP